MSILQLKIELEDITPKIWRRFLVSDSISFAQLHDIIQTVMRWEDYHLFEFKVGTETLSCDEEGHNLAEASFGKLERLPEFQKMLNQLGPVKGSRTLDVGKINKILQEAEKTRSKPKFDLNTKISELVNTRKQKFRYTYDFGDDWEHALTVEKILDEKGVTEHPICLVGERACPPEDCGSIPGYYELQEIQKDKKHPEYEDRIIEWLGEDFDFEHFDLTAVNRELRKLARRKK